MGWAQLPRVGRARRERRKYRPQSLLCSSAHFLSTDTSHMCGDICHKPRSDRNVVKIVVAIDPQSLCHPLSKLEMLRSWWLSLSILCLCHLLLFYLLLPLIERGWQFPLLERGPCLSVAKGG